MTSFACSLSIQRAATVAGVLLLAGSTVPSGALPLRPAAREPATNADRVAVIVRCQDPQDPALLRRIERLGGRHGRAWRVIRSLEVSLPPRAEGQLARLPGVVHVSPDAAVRKLDEFGYAAVGADVAYTS